MRKPSNNPITLGYGATSYPYSASNPHAGVDFSYSPDNKIYAPEGGQINYVGDLGTCGTAVELTSGGHKHRFCHLSQPHVSSGQNVSEGQVIGIMGSTGYTFGAHLHWVMWVNGTRANGLNYVTYQGEQITMTPDALNALAQVGWDKQIDASDPFVKNYNGKPPLQAIVDVEKSVANRELRRKAKEYEQLKPVLDDATNWKNYAINTLIPRMKELESQGAVTQAEIDELAKKADDLEQSIKEVNK